jgi:hypothetical protein
MECKYLLGLGIFDTKQLTDLIIANSAWIKKAHLI